MESILLNAPFSLNEVKENPELISEFKGRSASGKMNAYLQSLATPYGVKVSVDRGLRVLNAKGMYDQDDPLPFMAFYTDRKALIDFLMAMEVDCGGKPSIEEIEGLLEDLGDS